MFHGRSINRYVITSLLYFLLVSSDKVDVYTDQRDAFNFLGKSVPGTTGEDYTTIQEMPDTSFSLNDEIATVDFYEGAGDGADGGQYN